MKSILITIAFLTFFSVANAQETDAKKIFTSVEQDPMPAGGMGAFYQYLGTNTRYPDSAAKKRVEGKVFVTFVVERDGSLTDVKILRGVSPDIDAEAIHVVGSAPKWKPGIQNGRTVRVQYSVVINFKLPEKPVIVRNSKKVDSVSITYATGETLTVYIAVEQEPTPKGGMAAFYNYLANNIYYPDDAKKKNIQGKVFLTFVVEKDGTLSHVQILRGLSEDIDAEAVRVLSNAPKWNPGMQNGKPVRVQYNVPISFSLTSK